MKLVVSIALGGALGAVARHYLSAVIARWLGNGFPWGVLGVNVVGSFCLGALAGLMIHAWSPSAELRAFLVVGLLGALTTFSTFSLDTVLLIERGRWDLATLYCVVSVILCVGGLFSGLRGAAALV